MTLSGHAPGSAVIGVTVGLTCLSTVIALTRLFTRIKIVKKEGWDDVFISIATVLTIALTVDMCQQVKYGMSRHESTLTAHDVTMSLKWFWASVWIYYLALCFVKLSILTQYLRVIPHERFRLACYVLMAIVVVYSCCTFFGAIFSCTPVRKFWTPSMTTGHCLDLEAVWFANTSINITTDIATAILPLPVLNSLSLPKRQKYALMVVFALGGFTCIISILRLQALYVVSHTTDISWYNPLAAIWSSTEVNVGILCSCLPTLKGLVNHFFPNLFETMSTRRGSVPVELSQSSRRRNSGFANLGYGRRENDDFEKVACPPADGTVFGNGTPGLPLEDDLDYERQEVESRGDAETKSSDLTSVRRYTAATMAYQIV